MQSYRNVRRIDWTNGKHKIYYLQIIKCKIISYKLYGKHTGYSYSSIFNIDKLNRYTAITLSINNQQGSKSLYPSEKLIKY